MSPPPKRRERSLRNRRTPRRVPSLAAVARHADPAGLDYDGSEIGYTLPPRNVTLRHLNVSQTVTGLGAITPYVVVHLTAGNHRTSRRMQAGRPIRILIADDHPLIIEGLALSLSKRGIELAGHAAATADVIDRFRQCRPDVVVMDVGFGSGPTGLDAAREVIALDPEARIVFYTQYDQDEIVREAYRLGGRGLVPKVQPADVLADVIEQVQLGKIHFLPDIAERLALMGVRGDDSPRAKLDSRELDVFTRLARGQTTEEIACALSLSRKTISLVVQAVKDKLGVQRSAEITRLAIRHHLIET